MASTFAIACTPGLASVSTKSVYWLLTRTIFCNDPVRASKARVEVFATRAGTVVAITHTASVLFRRTTAGAFAVKLSAFPVTLTQTVITTAHTTLVLDDSGCAFTIAAHAAVEANCFVAIRQHRWGSISLVET